jgi:DNA-directed RNA polymerase subunit alpha
LSSLPGSAITSIKVAGAQHEFSVLPGIKEDVITICLNLKRVCITMVSDEPQTITLKVKGIKEVTAGDIKVPGGVEILNPELVIANLTDKSGTSAISTFLCIYKTIAILAIYTFITKFTLCYIRTINTLPSI